MQIYTLCVNETHTMYVTMYMQWIRNAQLFHLYRHES